MKIQYDVPGKERKNIAMAVAQELRLQQNTSACLRQLTG
jgi:hypothetical protein